MLDVNDFTAIRISLASPEQTRSWSYGEVTKPETINYRTLKPEKDGLFCEKIFGPTKDFECYCGKYKRVRYKGIICDKCGVEVTRAKVRRERMGHIELASPVSHIWFVKGTPSRLSLLLNISPRSLERVIYFAQYVVTWVDEDARTALQESAQAEYHRLLAELEENKGAQIQDVRQQYAAQLEALNEQKLQTQAKAQEERAAAGAELQERVDALALQLNELMQQEAVQEFALEGAVIVAPGETVNADHLARLQSEAATVTAQNDTRIGQNQDDELLKLSAEQERIEQRIIQELEPINRQATQEQARAKEALEAKLDDIQDLRAQTLLTDVKVRELRDKYGPVFRAGMGAEAILEILSQVDQEELREKLQQEVQTTAGQRRKKATKRLRVVEAFRKSGNLADWMILSVLPVLPPDLRPMVQLDGGRFATSDLNDLYRRVINRNNRLRRLMELGAPDIIIRNEKRMLQEAVDSLIDNGRRGRAVAGSGNHKLKSLSDMLKGKQGRFRQNLLGKRVDYSGRSVIVVGPELQLHQCGLPKRMALEIFKPFVMRRLVELNLAHNIKSAKRIVERAKPEVWDVLEDVIHDRPVLLNRAPTLHRLGIQAFMPVLIEGSAIQIHPLVCSAFNADFDGDQMAVHVPLSQYAVEEAKRLMLSTHNLLSPSSGDPIVAPTLDMVLGCYYMTLTRPTARGEGHHYSSISEAKLAYDTRALDLQAEVNIRSEDGTSLKTSIGRILFNEVLPAELRFKNQLMDRKALRQLVSECHLLLGNVTTAAVVDQIKNIGFRFATQSGTTIAMNDLEVPIPKDEILSQAEQKLAQIEAQFQRGLITEEERYTNAIQIWQEASDNLAAVLPQYLDPFGPIHMMANSGAKGNIAQIRQMAGMRGLMSDPSGRIIELPIKSSFREGLSVLEYFISTHGARKGLADTALRTADSGYLTRRLIDVSQDVIVLQEDCETLSGIWITSTANRALTESIGERIVGRAAAEAVVNPATGEIIIDRNEMIDQAHALQIVAAGIDRVYVRSPLVCQARHGICQLCYGWSLGQADVVNEGEAVGIIAAQSIGEPGTQLTMRTFHTGGVAGLTDITTGLPRVEELFEARVPKGQALISEIDGIAQIIRNEDGSRKIKIVSSDIYREEHPFDASWQVQVEEGQHVEAGAVLAQRVEQTDDSQDAEEDATALIPQETTILARVSGQVEIEDGRIAVYYEEKEEREYMVPAAGQIRVDDNQRVLAGEQLTEGVINPQDLLHILGREAVQGYIIEEVQQVYQSQGVNINDKHIETIVRQMLRKVRVDAPGDTGLLPGELVDRFKYEDINAKILAEGGEPATAETVLLGVTKASLSAESFLAAASFQETTRVLTEAAINGAIDRLKGLKENVIIGKLIPAQGLHLEEPPPAPALLHDGLPLDGDDDGVFPSENGHSPVDELDEDAEDLGDKNANAETDSEEAESEELTTA